MRISVCSDETYDLLPACLHSHHMKERLKIGMMASSRLKEYFNGNASKPGEKRLIRKIDFFILTFCCLMYDTISIPSRR